MSFEADQPIRDPDPRVPDALVDALFDRELSPEAQRQILGAVRHDAHTRTELERTAEALAALKDQPIAPDLTAQILARADGRRRFLPRRLRRVTRAARLGVSGAVLLVLLGVAGAQRAWPEALSLTPRDTPLADVNDALMGDAIQGANTLRSGVDQACSSLVSLPRSDTRAGFVRVEQLELTRPAAPRVRAAFTLVSLNAPPADPGTTAQPGRAFSATMLIRFKSSAPDARFPRPESETVSLRDDHTRTLRGVLP